MTAGGWLEREIRNGLGAMYLLHLQGKPANDAFAPTVNMWVTILTRTRVFDERLDTPRIRAGFLRLAAAMTRWPVPRDLTDAMPPRTQQRRLARPKLPPEAVRRHLDSIREILGHPGREECERPAGVDPEPPATPHGSLLDVEAELRAHYRGIHPKAEDEDHADP